jgi:hypothetical protein
MPNFRVEFANGNIISLRKTRSLIHEDYYNVLEGKILFAIIQANSEDDAREKINSLVENFENKQLVQ